MIGHKVDSKNFSHNHYRDTENFKLKPLSNKGMLNFSCHPGVSCFNKCCHEIDVILTPLDILRLKTQLKIKSGEFLNEYTYFQQIKGTGIPLVKLQMKEKSKGACIFLDEKIGCTVYKNRPLVCRTYPVGSASMDPRQGESKESRFIIKEEMCKGHEEKKEWKLEDWMKDQGAKDIEDFNKPWLETVAKLKAINLDDKHQHQISLFIMACYDLDTFHDFVFKSSLLKKFKVEKEMASSIKKDHEKLLQFGILWLQFALFGEGPLQPNNTV